MREVVTQIRRAVVKILTHSDSPNYDQPWQTHGATSSVGSGVVVRTVKGLRVLTNAHVVENQVFVEVRRFGKSKKWEAEVEGVGHVCDLALVRVFDDAFFEGIDPLELGELPVLGDAVTALGYPVGGDRLSLTRGVVSRIGITRYAQSQRRLLAVQIDAAINAGNSGGPVVDNEGRIVGIAFQAYDEGQNIGFMIGVSVVRHFLEDLEDGTFDGFPDLGIFTQTLESKALRAYIGLPEKERGGILVRHVSYGGSGWRCLKRGDVLLRLGRVRVAADGSVPFRTGERIDFQHVVSEAQVGQALPVEVWRAGKKLCFDVKLKQPQHLVPEDRYDISPTYYLYGGLLFVPLTRDYLKTWGEEWWNEAPSSLLNIYETGLRTPNRQEVVVLQKVMADRTNRGYHDLESIPVRSAQRGRVGSMKELIRRIEGDDEPFVRIELGDGTLVVLSRDEVEKRKSAIQRRFGYPFDRSADLRDDGDDD